MRCPRVPDISRCDGCEPSAPRQQLVPDNYEINSNCSIVPKTRPRRLRRQPSTFNDIGKTIVYVHKLGLNETLSLIIDPSWDNSTNYRAYTGSSKAVSSRINIGRGFDETQWTTWFGIWECNRHVHAVHAHCCHFRCRNVGTGIGPGLCLHRTPQGLGSLGNQSSIRVQRSHHSLHDTVNGCKTDLVGCAGPYRSPSVSDPGLRVAPRNCARGRSAQDSLPPCGGGDRGLVGGTRQKGRGDHRHRFSVPAFLPRTPRCHRGP